MGSFGSPCFRLRTVNSERRFDKQNRPVLEASLPRPGGFLLAVGEGRGKKIVNFFQNVGDSLLKLGEKSAIISRTMCGGSIFRRRSNERLDSNERIR